jgi:hypothetical protein
MERWWETLTGQRPMAGRPSVPRDSRFLSMLKGRPDGPAYVGECGSDWNWWVDEEGDEKPHCAYNHANHP